MFPSVLKEDTFKQKLKQRQWDDRLGNKSTIPDYSPLKDKHTKNYRKLISNKKEEDLELTPKPKATTYFQRRMELIEELSQLHKPNKQLLDQYQELAGKYKLPNFYIYYTLLPLLSPAQNITQYLFNQKKMMKEQSSHYHKIATAVRAREECLQRIRKTLRQINEDKLQTYKIELKEEVEHLRFLTQNAIDEIKRWRDDLGRLEQRPKYYNDNQENYLLKILNDNKFIFSSKLAGVLSFAQKNDPFLLVPVKRAQGKESSMFIEIVETSKEVTHYQRYMDYLASEKAYELSSTTPIKPKEGKVAAVERIYKISNLPKSQTVTLGKQQQDDNFKKMQMQKLRQQRLKKNQQRIKSIKGIYQTYSKKLDDKQYRSERKMPQTDNEDRRGSLKKRSESIKILRPDKNQSDNQFQSLVKNKVEFEKINKSSLPLKRLVESKSATKLPKTEDKMIESLRDIQSTLRSKLQVIQQEDKMQNSSFVQGLNSTQTKFTRKNNEEIIKQLKAEILSKIERETSQKQKIKKKKREEQQKALQQIKQKLKKEMQQKLQQKKKEKMLEREELEKKLKEEEDRLNSQRQLQLQLQLKLNKQKQLRELEKIRREALERQKMYKDQLEKQQSLRKERESTIEHERRQKQKLIEQLKKRQLKEQIEEELRNQIKDRQSDGPKTSDKMELELLRGQKQAQLSKQIEQLKMKEGVQMQQLKRENQLRERMLKLKKQEEQLKRKEIEHLMKQAIHQQKEDLERDTVKRRIQIEENMRSNVKEKLLEEYRNEKEAQVDKIKHQRQKQLEEEVYRQKIRDKIERQMRMEAIQRTKKQLDEREHKKYQIKSKLDQVKNHFDKEIIMDKGKIQQQVKKQMIQKVIFDKQAEKEAAKYDLRLQFQKELMASAIPQIYQNKDSFLIKNINYFEGDQHLNNKLGESKPTNQKPTNNNNSNKKGEVKELIDTMTLQQLKVYEKQKEKVNQTKEDKIILPTRMVEQEEGFQLMKVQASKKEEEGFQVKIIKNRQHSNKLKESSKTDKNQNKKKKAKKSSSEELDSEDQKIKNKEKEKKKKRKQRKHYYQEQSQDSEQIEKKRKKNKRKRKQSSDQQPSSEEQIHQKSMSPKKKRELSKKETQNQRQKQKQKQKQILQQKQKTKQKPIKQQKHSPVKQNKGNPQNAIVHYDVDNKQKLNFNPIDQITIKPQKTSNNTQKYKISLQAIPEAQFDEYLQVHLSRVPQIQLIIQLINREQLYRKLIGQLTFCLLVGQYQGRVIGLALAYHDRSRSDLRKFTIIHMSTYQTEDLKDFIISVSNFIFRKDPVDQLEFHYKFNEIQKDQLQFSQDFNKWFDKYGSVFQKKVDQAQFQRKYLLKRQFNQKCEVILGGVNKNTFRNLFSVYCGVLMSDTDMLQFKEELIDTLAPENQICYSIMVSQLFRTYLSPDEAQLLKNKVKQFAKLKEMLILVVMMQKKKLKLQELKLYEYKNLIQLNMRLMSQGKQIIRYCKDSNTTDMNRLYYAQLNQGFNLPFHFQTTSLPVEAHESQIRQISYFRLSPLPPFKLHIIKSSLYNAQMNILPTQNSKYKLFVLSAQQYNQIKQSNHIDLFMYIRLFLKNVKSHNVAVWKYVWLPEMTDKGAWNLRQYRSFLGKDFYTHDAINISYRQFLPGALIIEPEHRDLVITPPFIVGVMSMNLQQVSQGSPLYARMIEIDALKTLQVQK